MKNNTKQLAYRPKKQIVKATPKSEKQNQEIRFDQVIEYFIRVAWEHRAFLLITFIVLENTLLLVTMK